MTMYGSYLLFILIIVTGIFVGQHTSSADDLYASRFESLSEQQRDMLRECLVAHEKLSRLYANYKGAGLQTTRTPSTGENSKPFTYLCRKDGYALYRVLESTDQVKESPRGTLVRPEGFVQTALKSGEVRASIIAFGADSDEGFDTLSSLRFPIGPMAIEVWPVSHWLTAGRLYEGTDPMHIATGLSVHRTDPRLGKVVRLSFAYPSGRTREIDFLSEHLWAVVQSDTAVPAVNGSMYTQSTTIDYDVSVPQRPRMTRFTYSAFDKGSPRGALLDKRDFHFDTLEFVTPDLKEFEPSALGLSNITATPAKPDAWLWRLGLCVGGVVLVALAFLIRRRAIK